METDEYDEKVRKELKDIKYMMEAHQFYPVKPEKAFRKANKNNLYYIHPLWCAISILFEENLDEKTKRDGYLALLYHDILEDTTKELPEDISPEIISIVNNLTFPGSTQQEVKEIWKKDKVIRLYKLYDKVSNYLDKRWLTPEKKKIYEKYIIDLCKDVEENYGELNITKIARALVIIRKDLKKTTPTSYHENARR